MTNNETLERWMGRIEEKLDSILQRLDNLTDKTDDHERRIKTLEIWRASVEGSVKGVTGVGATIKWAWPIGAALAAFLAGHLVH